MKSLTKTKKLTAVLLALAIIAATVFACGFGFTSKSASAEVKNKNIEDVTSYTLNGDGNYEYTYRRAGEYTINDSGPLEQSYDVFDYNMLPSLSTLMSNGYIYITITVQMQMKEVYKGYQQVFLYKTEDASYNNFQQRMQVEYGGNKLVKEYSMVTFKFKTTFVSTYMVGRDLGTVVRYGATGGAEDDWCNKDCRITVLLSKKIINNENLAVGSSVTIGFDYDYNNPKN